MALWLPMLCVLAAEDEEFLTRLCDQYQEMILRKARRKLPVQEAEEVFGAVVERLLPHLDQIAELSDRQQQAYVYSTTRSVIADHYRHLEVERRFTVHVPEGDMERLPGDMPEVDEALLHREQTAQLRLALRKLPPEHRKLLEMKYIRRLRDEEIGRLIGARPDAVRKQIYRLRQRLRDALKEE